MGTFGHWEKLYVGTGSFQNVYRVCWANSFSSVSWIICTSLPEHTNQLSPSLGGSNQGEFTYREISVQIVLTAHFKLWLARTGISYATTHLGESWVKKRKVKYMYFCPTIKHTKKSSADLQAADKFISLWQLKGKTFHVLASSLLGGGCALNPVALSFNKTLQALL